MINRPFSQHKVPLLLGLLSIFIILFCILPAYEELNYFQSKNNQLKQHIQTLKHDALLAQEYAKISPANKTKQQQKYEKFENENNEIFFLKGLQALQLHLSQIDLNQKIKKSNIPGQFTHILTTHEFSASFEVLLEYLREIESSNIKIILDKISIKNNEILNDNPTLSIKSNLSFYIKK